MKKIDRKREKIVKRGKIERKRENVWSQH